MVHALRQAHSMLQPEGLLVNIHDLPVPHVIEVCTDSARIKAGWLMDSTDFDNERSAFNALAQVVSEEHFVLVDERDFNTNTYVDDIQELQEWLADRWQTALLPISTIRRLDDLLRQVGKTSKVVLNVPTRMTKLRAMK